MSKNKNKSKSPLISFSGCTTDTPDGKCKERPWGFGHCRLHEAESIARWMTASELKALRVYLKQVVPYTDAQRERKALKVRLRSISSTARTLADAESRARDAGATEDEIVNARRGES